MKRYRFFLGFLLFSLLVVFCSSKTTFVRPEYKNRKIDKAALVVIPVEDIQFKQGEGTFENLGIQFTQEKYLPQFERDFKSVTKKLSGFQQIDFTSYSDDLGLESRMLKLKNKDQISVDLPTKQIDSSLLAESSKSPIYILFLQNPNISLHMKRRETSVSKKYYTVSGSTAKDATINPLVLYDAFVSLNTRFAIFDQSSSSLVSYGKTFVEEKLVVQKSFPDMFSELVADLAKVVLKNTPFEK